MEIFNRLSKASRNILFSLNPKAKSIRSVPALEVISAVSSSDKAIALSLKDIDLAGLAGKKVRLGDWLTFSFHEAALSNAPNVDSHHLLLGLLLNFDAEIYFRVKKSLLKAFSADIEEELSQYVTELPLAASQSQPARAKQPGAKIVGRQRDLNTLIARLSSSTPKPVLILGPSGSGKSFLVEELANRIAAGNVPPHLQNCRVLKIKLGTLLSSVSDGGSNVSTQFVMKVLSYIASVHADKYNKTILFFDDLRFGYNMFWGFELNEMAGNILMIGAATQEMHEKLWDNPIGKMWDFMQLSEHSDAEVEEILKYHSKRWTKATGVKFSKEAISKIISYHKENDFTQVLPGAGIKSLEHLAIYKRYLGDNAGDGINPTQGLSLTAKGEVLTAKKVPPTSRGVLTLEASDVETFLEEDGNNAGSKNAGSDFPAAKLLELEEELKKEIIGQDDALAALARSFRVSSLKLHGQSRPIGTFLFLGPTGVGKSQTAKALASALFGRRDGNVTKPNNFLRIDMTEFAEKHTVSKLFGAPPGYIGYDDSNSLCDFAADNPSSVVLFDEIDKAHPEVLNSLLHLMDEGEIRNNAGEYVSFENVVVIMTSNHGAAELSRANIGFGGVAPLEGHEDGLKSILLEQIKKQLKPEFINRFDDIVVFKVLDTASLVKILEVMLKPLNAGLKNRGIKLKINKYSKDYLIRLIKSHEYGARELRRVLNRELVEPVSRILLKDGKIKEIRVSARGGKLVIYAK